MKKTKVNIFFAAAIAFSMVLGLPAQAATVLDSTGTATDTTTTVTDTTTTVTDTAAATATGATELDGNVVIVLDPGHDGSHTGAQYNGHSEETDTLTIASYCKERLESYDNITVYMTREVAECSYGGKSISTGECLKKRVEDTIAQNANYFISFHLNASAQNPEATGAEVYYSKNDGASSKCASLAGSILKHLHDDVGLKNRGIKRANYYVLNGTTAANIPGVLIEHCFMTNTSDVESYLSGDSRLKKLGYADADGIIEYLGSASGTPTTAGTTEQEEEVDISTLTVEGLEAEPSGFGVGLTWDTIDDADYYQIYKYNTAKKKWKKLAETDDVEYYDLTLASGEKGSYKVRGIQKKDSELIKTAFSSKKSAVPGDGSVTDLSADAGAFNRSVVTWEEVAGADGYKVVRQSQGSDKWLTVTKEASDDGYIDETTKCGKSYRYRVRAYKTVDGKKVWGKAVKATPYFTTSTGKVTVKKGTLVKKGLQVNWEPKSKATGYIIYRKAEGEKKWTRLGKTKEGSYVDESVKWEKSYTYTVEAYRVKGGKTYKASEYDTKGVQTKAGTKIEGESSVTVEQMVAYYEKSKNTYPAATYQKYGAATITDFAQIVYDICEEYGIKAELVWAQICRETGYLQFGGEVKADQCNFCGLGAVGTGTGSAKFTSVSEGVTAQVQHLKMYASTEEGWEDDFTIIDPRYSEDLKGKAPLVEWLTIGQNPYGTGWATDENYGTGLISMMDTIVKMNKEEE